MWQAVNRTKPVMIGADVLVETNSIILKENPLETDLLSVQFPWLRVMCQPSSQCQGVKTGRYCHVFGTIRS